MCSVIISESCVCCIQNGKTFRGGTKMKHLAEAMLLIGVVFCFTWCTVESNRIELEKYKIKVSQQLK